MSRGNRRGSGAGDLRRNARGEPGEASSGPFPPPVIIPNNVTANGVDVTANAVVVTAGTK
jgi:hypothetical protein